VECGGKPRLSRRGVSAGMEETILPLFTNMATLTYNGSSINSNVVTGQLQEVLSVTKTALVGSYGPGDTVTYAVSLVNTGGSAFTGLTAVDDLGAYIFGADTLYPLDYVEGSLLYYVNGVLQPAPAVTAGPPLSVSGLTVPAGGNAVLLYEARANAYAPSGLEDTIVNNVSISGPGLPQPLEAEETIAARSEANLSISKALCPAVVAENDRLTYTFTVQNFGNLPLTLEDDAVITDTFDPILTGLVVTFNGETWTEGTQYSYDESTGNFATVAGQITVPAATYTRSSDGSITVTPGVSTLVVSGTV